MKSDKNKYTTVFTTLRINVFISFRVGYAMAKIIMKKLIA